MTEMLARDDVSGTSVLADGTLVHWTEGRSSWAAIEYPDGRKEAVPVWKPHPVFAEEKRLSAAGYDVHRDMTREERDRWARARAETTASRGGVVGVSFF